VNATAVNMRNCQIQLSMHVKTLPKNFFEVKVWTANLALLMFLPITLKQLNSFTSIDTLCCLRGLEFTHQTPVPEVPGSIPGADKDFLLAFLFCCCVLTLWSKLYYLSYFRNMQFVLQCLFNSYS